jgi:hypothetical protein
MTMKSAASKEEHLSEAKLTFIESITNQISEKEKTMKTQTRRTLQILLAVISVPILAWQWLIFGLEVWVLNLFNEAPASVVVLESVLTYSFLAAVYFAAFRLYRVIRLNTEASAEKYRNTIVALVALHFVCIYSFEAFRVLVDDISFSIPGWETHILSSAVLLAMTLAIKHLSRESKPVNNQQERVNTMSLKILDFLRMPKDAPRVVKFTEGFTGAYQVISIILIAGLSMTEQIDDGAARLLVVPVLLTWALVLFALRRRSRVASWIGFALLLRPTVVFLQQGLEQGVVPPEDFFSVMSTLAVGTSLIAAVLLLHPVVQAWVKAEGPQAST